MLLQITSRHNPKLKEALQLKERAGREREARFLIEGYRELTRAVKGGVVLEKLFICPSFFLGENEEELIAQIKTEGAYILECSPSVFEKLSYRDRPDGLVGVARYMEGSLSKLENLLKAPSLLLVAEGIEKPGNLGSIIRSADGAGADGVIVCDRCTDIHNPNVVRSSVGTLFTLPVVEAEGLETLLWLKKHHIQIVAATPQGKIPFTKADLTKPTAIAVGTEQLGLSDAWLKQADVSVSIPMYGVADSLNVSTATTLLLYEAIRQRG